MAEQAPLTLMAVHAHPDDEASSTGGVLAHYSREGIDTIVVTCTNGELGDAPGGIKPDEPNFDEQLVVETRRRELETSCKLLGVRHLEMLGYHDSGMMGWEQNEATGSFWQMPVEQAAQPLIRLFEQYRPDVVVTYDENGFYGHPDHIQANRITIFALDATGIPAKLYYPTFPHSMMPRFGEALAAAGVTFDEPPEDRENFGTPDELVTTRVDCTAVVAAKHAALVAHHSQTGSSFFLKMPETWFEELFGTESFVRHYDRTGAPTPEVDLFAGLR